MKDFLGIHVQRLTIFVVFRHISGFWHFSKYYVKLIFIKFSFQWTALTIEQSTIQLPYVPYLTSCYIIAENINGWENFVMLQYHTHTHTRTTSISWPFFWDHAGEPVPEENFWTLWWKGRLTEADTLTIWLGATPASLTSPPPPSPHFLQAGCPSCRPTNSVKALKATILQYHGFWITIIHSDSLKMWQYICGYNSGRTLLIFLLIFTLL